jgi:hypothetical protein
MDNQDYNLLLNDSKVVDNINISFVPKGENIQTSLGQVLTTNTKQLTTNSKSYLSVVLNCITNNKLYFLIFIVVIILAGLIGYLYIKNKKLFSFNNITKNITNDINEHYVLDADGNHIKISSLTGLLNQKLEPLPTPMQEPSLDEIMMLHKQHEEKQKIIKNNLEITEDENIAQHNLTNSELADINKKLQDM